MGCSASGGPVLPWQEPGTDSVNHIGPGKAALCKALESIICLTEDAAHHRRCEILAKAPIASMKTPAPGAPPSHLPSNTRGIGEALARSEPMALLASRMRESQTRLTCIQSLLPEPMRGHVSAGPVDDTAWALLVSSSAIAAKLRQLIPTLQEELQSCGFAPKSMQVRLLTARGSRQG